MTAKPAHLAVAFYADQPSVTIEQIVETIRYEMTAHPDHGYSRSERIRSAVFFLPESMPVAQKNESRPANLSISWPVFSAARTYSMPSARVKATSCTALAPASCM